MVQRKSIYILQLVILCSGLVASEEPGWFSNFRHIKPQSSADTQQKSVLQLISRLLPNHAHLIKVEIDFSLEGNTFILQKSPRIPFLLIIASNGVSACKGLHYYMKYFLNLHVSWSGNRLGDIPDELPNVELNSTSSSQFIYYQNVCAWSYSFAWWKSSDWRKHVDWMALMGISFTIAPIQESIWSRVYTELGMNISEINEHFTGPAFQAWQRMGNIRGWGGPLGSGYPGFQITLQKQIIQMQRDLGMTVAIPAFAGHVPVAFKRIFPNASLTPVDCWNKFPKQYCCPLFIDPNDPLFTIVGVRFLREVINEYGTDHIYFSDPFNEIQPKEATPDYLTKTSQNIYNSMQLLDSKAVWLLQGWMFVKNPFWSDRLIESFLTAIPQGRMLILDLQSEQFPQYGRTKSYYGQPFIWCMLHNFGGTLGMHGSVDFVVGNMEKARSMKNTTMIGVGITPEGINPNYALYEFVLEKGWGEYIRVVEDWFLKYADTRYGVNKVPQSVWLTILSTVYSYKGVIKIHGKYTICRRPSSRLTPWTWYDTDKFEGIWRTMVENITLETYDRNELLQHDLVDITRQCLQNRFDKVYLNLMNEYSQKNRSLVEFYGDVLAEIIVDMDQILRTNKNFLLGNWLKSARDLGASKTLAQVFEVNARNQITTWGPNGEIVDYATKQWSGLVERYFLKRWKLFFKELLSSLDNNTRFNDNEFKIKVLNEVENPFNMERFIYPTNPTGASYLISKRIYNKWSAFDKIDQFSITVPSFHNYKRKKTK